MLRAVRQSRCLQSTLMYPQLWLRHGIVAETLQPNGVREPIVVIRLSEVVAMMKGDKYTREKRSVAVTDKIGKKAYGVVMPDDSMAPVYAKGDIVIVDPDAKPMPGKNVLAIVGGAPLIRRYSVKNKRGELHPEHKDFDVERIAQRTDTIIGRCVGMFRDDAD